MSVGSGTDVKAKSVNATTPDGEITVKEKSVKVKTKNMELKVEENKDGKNTVTVKKT